VSEAPDSPEHVKAERRRVVREAQHGADWQRGEITGSDGPPLLPTRGPVSGTHGESWRERHWSSRTLHRVGEVVAHSAAGLIAASAVIVWLGVGALVGFPDWWETVLYASSSTVTLVMVFAIQHTQARQQSATQRKLDELLRAQPSADNTLISVEEAPDQELEARATLNLSDREAERNADDRKDPEG
jgi:low affinity Fe/Cu permease